MRLCIRVCRDLPLATRREWQGTMETVKVRTGKTKGCPYEGLTWSVCRHEYRDCRVDGEMGGDAGDFPSIALELATRLRRALCRIRNDDRSAAYVNQLRNVSDAGTTTA